MSLVLDRNLVVSAGAGSGKTHALVTVALGLYAGAGREAVPPSRTWAVTFTDKAAHELRQRVKARVAALAQPDLAPEPELTRLMESVDMEVPGVEHWQSVAAELEAAPIGTFHALSAHLLRTYAFELGLDPSFEVLDEEASGTLFRRVTDDLVLSRLGAPDVMELTRALGGPAGLSRALVSTHHRFSEEWTFAPPELRTEVDGAAETGELAPAVRALRRSIVTLRESRHDHLHHIRATLEFESARLQSLEPQDLDRWFGAAARVYDACPRGRLPRAARADLQPFVEAWENVRRVWAGGRERKLIGTYLRLANELAVAHQTEKDRRGHLEFADLVRLLRDLLRDDLAVRAAVKAQVGVMLVDEFQDTNSIQMDLVRLICEERSKCRRLPPDRDIGTLEFEPRVLCAVGDRKQSIYGFRGADVSIFQGLMNEALQSPDWRIHALTRSWRSRPTIVRTINEIFSRVFGGPSPPRSDEAGFSVVWEPADALRPVRSPSERVAVEVLETEAHTDPVARRTGEAARVAAHVRGLLLQEGYEGREVAVLLRTHGQVPSYRRALTECGISSVLVGGRGFHAATEVRDLLALLLVIAEPAARWASAVVLRSPIYGVSDDAFMRLADARMASLADHMQNLARRSSDVVPGLEAADREALRVLAAVVDDLHPIVDQIGAASSLDMALRRLEVREALAMGPEPEQRWANVDKLLDRLRSARALSASSAARELLARGENLRDREPPAEVAAQADPNAVRVMTIHAAKGLEFPVVVVPELGSDFPTDAEQIAFDRELGLAMRLRDPVGRSVHSVHGEVVRGRVRARRHAETRRLLYVALTRARDRLVLAGKPGRRPQKDNWRVLLDAVMPELEVAIPEIARVPVPGPEPETTEEPGETVAVDVERRPPDLELALRRCDPLLGRDGDLEFSASVTALADLARCPRRYFLRVVAGLDEHARFDRTRDDVHDLEPTDYRVKGNLAHALLERVDLRHAATDPRGALEACAEAEGVVLGDDADLQADLGAFLETELMQSVARAHVDDPRRVWREIPFVLRVEGARGRADELGGEQDMQGRTSAAVALAGQIDLVWIDDDGGLVVVDYKLARSARGREMALAYAEQLRSYALAVRRLWPEAPRVRAGLAWLRDRGMEPVVESYSDEPLDAHERALSRQVDRLTELRRQRGSGTHPWPKLDDPGDCGSCGFAPRCWKA